MKLWIMLVSLVAFSAVAARADTVILKNGDKIDGTITALDSGKLIIDTGYAGELKIDVAQISTFSTTGPIQLRLSDGTLIRRQLASDPTGGVALEGGLLGNSHLSLTDIDAINPPTPVWTGDIKFGALLSRGNTQSDNLNFGIDIAHKGPVDIITFTANYLYGTTHDRATGVQTTTADNWQTDLKYEHDFTKKFYSFADLLVSKDRLAFLDLRVAPSVGLGYRWYNTPKFSFSTEGGLAWIYEEYTNGTPHREDFSLVLSYHVTYAFNDKVSCFNNLSYYPSVENGRNYLIETDAGLHVILTKKFFSELKCNLNYDSNPALGALKTNTQVALSLGYTL